jgi:hypothetical protein
MVGTTDSSQTDGGWRRGEPCKDILYRLFIASDAISNLHSHAQAILTGLKLAARYVVDSNAAAAIGCLFL